MIALSRKPDEASNEQQEWLRMTLDYADNIIATMREPFLVLDQDLRIVTANRSFYQNYNVTLEATQGQLIYDIGNRQWDIPKLRTLLEDVLPQNHAFDDFEVVHDFPSIGRKVMLLNARRIRKPGNHSELILLSIEDITERRRMEDALRDSDEFNRSMIDSSPDCIKVLDLEGNLISMQCGHDLLGIEDIGPYLNTSWIEFWHGDDRVAARAAVEQARIATGGKAANFVGYFRTLRGEPKWWDVSISPILNATGQPAQLLAVSRDVTQRTKDVDALRESQSRLRYAADAAGLTYVEIDLESSQARKAENFGAVMGYAVSSELVTEVFEDTRLLLEHVVPSDRANVEHALEDFLAGKPVGKIEYRVIGDNGSERWIESRWSLERDGNNKPLKTFAINLDITERKLAETTLRESQRFLRSSLDALSGQIAVLDETGTILEVNEAWRRFADENQFVAANYGVGSSYLMDEMLIAPEECNLATCNDGIRDVIAGRRATFELEYPCHSPTQHRWYMMRVTRFESPGPVRVVIVHDNITERKLAQVQLQQNHDTFVNLIENSPFGLYIVDAQFRLMQVSAASQNVFRNIHPLIGRDFEEILAILWPEEFAQMAIGRFHHTLRTGEPFAMRNFSEQRRDNADVESYDWKIERITLPNGQFGVVCYFYDITERKLAEVKLQEQTEALADLHRRKDEFLAMLSHELRSPLAPISNAVHILRLQSNEDVLQKQARGVIERQIGQLTRLVDDLMEVSRITTGRVHLRKERIVIGGIIERAVETAFPMMEQRRHALTVSVPPDPIWLDADAGRLEQVIVNLLTNAAKYTEENGQVWLTVEDNGGEWRVMSGEKKSEESWEASSGEASDLATRHSPLNTLSKKVNFDERAALSRTQGVASSDGLGGAVLSCDEEISQGRTVRPDQPDSSGSSIGTGQHRGGTGPTAHERIPELSEHRAGVTNGSGNAPDTQSTGGLDRSTYTERTAENIGRNQSDALGVTSGTGIKALSNSGELRVTSGSRSGELRVTSGESSDLATRHSPLVTNNRVTIRIRDTGVGIAPGLLPRVFDLFTQAERSLDRSQGGLGIGLALVQRLVEMHGGTVEVTSTLGKGSEFVVRLPISKDEMIRMKDDPKVDSSFILQPSCLKVLIVDDNDDSAETLAMLLKALKHDVRTANDGLAALETASGYRPDVVLLDIGLPMMDGYEVAAKMRLSPAHKTTVLVALTGYGQDSDRQKSKDAGFDHHLVKPADFAKLQQILTRASEKV